MTARSLSLGWISRAAIGVLLVIYGVPFLWLVATSFKSDTQIFANEAGLIFQPTLDTYREIVNADLLRACVNSAIIAAGTTALTLVLATPAAYALARVRGALVSAGLGALIILQITPQPASLIPLYRVLGGWNLLGSQLGVVLADSALLLPFCILIIRPFFLAIPREVEEAGLVDGASKWRVFWQIVLPITLNGVATGATIIFFIAWGEFLYAITFLTDATQYPISVLIASQIGQYGILWSRMMAIAVVASLPILAIYAFTYRLLRDGLALGSVR
ncbi:MAG TPA: carbohydrate ABC transporter permease [Candidatus Dormibacteraeota bacterium]|nr:carbohydrate ABC transporter permease [Candidatus Dormibacteraeota bacterium]